MTEHYLVAQHEGLEHAGGLKQFIRDGSLKRDDTTEAVCGTALPLSGYTFDLRLCDLHLS